MDEDLGLSKTGEHLNLGLVFLETAYIEGHSVDFCKISKIFKRLPLQ